MNFSKLKVSKNIKPHVHRHTHTHKSINTQENKAPWVRTSWNKQTNKIAKTHPHRKITELSGM